MAYRSTRTKKPAAPAAEPQSLFAVLKMVSSGGGSEEGEAPPPRVLVRGIHPTEDQAYAAAITELIYDLEEAEREPQSKLRAIAKTATLPLKDRLKSLQSCQGSEDRIEFLIKKSNMFPEEEKMKDMDSLLQGPLLPYSYWDSSDEEDYDPEDEEEGAEEEEEEDDDMEDLVNEEDAMQGIEGSGVKSEEEAAMTEDEKKVEKTEEEVKPDKTEECV